jgi:hypothetical protein
MGGAASGGRQVAAGARGRTRRPGAAIKRKPSGATTIELEATFGQKSGGVTDGIPPWLAEAGMMPERAQRGCMGMR